MKNDSSGNVRVAAPFRRTTRAPSAISAGGPSPMGEPLAILPPMVAALRTCTEAKRRSNSPKSGKCRPIEPSRSLQVIAAPMRRLPPPSVKACSSGTRLVEMKMGMSRCCLVIQSPTSVAPERMVASGFSA